MSSQLNNSRQGKEMLKKKKLSTDSQLKFKRGLSDTHASLQSRQKESRGGARVSSSGMRGGQASSHQTSFKNGTKQANIDLMNARDESEGEAGDARIYAERANGAKMVQNAEPVPKFEKSVFDMKYNEKQQQQPQPENFQNRFKYFGDAAKPDGHPSERGRDGPKAKPSKKDRSPSAGRGAAVDPAAGEDSNPHQLVEYPADFPQAHSNLMNLRQVHPERITTKFQENKDTQITFSSDFCSGNLSRVTRGCQKNEYWLWVSHDGAPYQEDGYRTWFYFSVKGVPQGEQLTFTFKNLNNQTKLYGQGLKPVFRVLPTTQKKWRRLFTKANFFFQDDQFTLKLTHMFSTQPGETTYFAFSYPWSYQDSQDQMAEIEHKFAAAGREKNLYFHRETVYYSIEGRKMEMMTISSRDGITDERETIPEGDSQGLFPDAVSDPARRPYRFNPSKKVVVFTARVHPGETPGSHVLNGAIAVLADLKSEQGRLLRKHYIFKIIPTLNPDGVSRGYYRLDTLGQNLNRFYNDSTRKDQPTVWAIKQAITQYATEYKNLQTYIDFHAHASKKGVFIFGNALPDAELQADNITFAKLVAMNCLNFDMNECNFSEKIMAVKDKNGMSRDGSSRVALQKATGITHCYTLECNYHNGKRINTLAPKLVRSQGAVEEDTPVCDPNSKIYANTSSPPFTQEIFEDVGHAVAVALLDQIGANPVSRVPLSCFRSVENVRDDIMHNLAKYSAGQVNVCGVNHFSATNTKVGRQYSKTEAAVLKKDANGKKQSHSASKDGQPVNMKAGGSKHGTFGAAPRLANTKKRTAKPREAQAAALVKSKTFALGEAPDQLVSARQEHQGGRPDSQLHDGTERTRYREEDPGASHHGQLPMMLDPHSLTPGQGAGMPKNYPPYQLSPKQQQFIQRNGLPPQLYAQAGQYMHADPSAMSTMLQQQLAVANQLNYASAGSGSSDAGQHQLQKLQQQHGLAMLHHQQQQQQQLRARQDQGAHHNAVGLRDLREMSAQEQQMHIQYMRHQANELRSINGMYHHHSQNPGPATGTVGVIPSEGLTASLAKHRPAGHQSGLPHAPRLNGAAAAAHHGHHQTISETNQHLGPALQRPQLLQPQRQRTRDLSEQSHPNRKNFIHGDEAMEPRGSQANNSRVAATRVHLSDTQQRLLTKNQSATMSAQLGNPERPQPGSSQLQSRKKKVKSSNTYPKEAFANQAARTSTHNYEGGQSSYASKNSLPQAGPSHREHIGRVNSLDNSNSAAHRTPQPRSHLPMKAPPGLGHPSHSNEFHSLAPVHLPDISTGSQSAAHQQHATPLSQHSGLKDQYHPNALLNHPHINRIPSGHHHLKQSINAGGPPLFKQERDLSQPGQQALASPLFAGNAPSSRKFRA